MTDSNQNQNETLNNGADAWQNPNGAYPFPPSDSTANNAENDPYKANGYQNVPPYSAMPYPTFTPPATATPVDEAKKKRFHTRHCGFGFFDNRSAVFRFALV